MALKINEPNALGTLGLRQVSFVPEHFTSVILDNGINIQNLQSWINYNLNSRYAISKTYTISDKGIMIEATKVGFEDPAEMTIFMLGCPLLKI